MTDPDAPSVTNPIYREFVHWVVVNIPGHDVRNGEELLEYTGPMPAFNSGCHRYIFLLFKQTKVFSAADIADMKGYFDEKGRITKTCAWAAERGMGSPVSSFTFRCQWSPAIDEIHAAAGFTPPPEFQSPSQKAAVAAAAASAAAAATAEVISSMEKASVDEAPALPHPAVGGLPPIKTSEVYEGAFVNKKYGNEMLHRSRFCWIDPGTRSFFWSKTAGKTDPKKKSLNLKADLMPDGISITKNRIVMLHHSGKPEENIHLEITGTADDSAAAADWYAIAVACSKL